MCSIKGKPPNLWCMPVTTYTYTEVMVSGWVLLKVSYTNPVHKTTLVIKPCSKVVYAIHTGRTYKAVQNLCKYTCTKSLATKKLPLFQKHKAKHLNKEIFLLGHIVVPLHRNFPLNKCLHSKLSIYREILLRRNYTIYCICILYCICNYVYSQAPL